MKIMFVSGIGFFTDAYDLFVIGIVVYLLTSQWNLSTGQVSLLNSITLAASAVGALIFGRVADILGRKRIYGYEVLILAVGAIASAFSPNYTFLLISRAVLGIGIGGDYPVSATIMSEYAGKNTRGRMVGAVFANQAAGLIVGPLIASIFLASGLSDNLTWRLLLGLGAIPGLAVFYLRRQIHETPRFAMAGGATEEAEAAIAAATGKAAGSTGAAAPAAPSGESRARVPQSALGGFLILARSRRMLLWLIGAAACWALLDFCYYGNTISTPEILALLNPKASELHNILVQLLIFVVFAVPGYVCAILFLAVPDPGGQRGGALAPGPAAQRRRRGRPRGVPAHRVPERRPAGAGHPGAVTVRRDGARLGEPALRCGRPLPGSPGQGGGAGESLTRSCRAGGGRAAGAGSAVPGGLDVDAEHRRVFLQALLKPGELRVAGLVHPVDHVIQVV